ncbi:TIGR02922 family protein [Neiella marina]|uniref:TIGR02922 family protein n=1 Tax=Neiella marina TaxID=508461 RepID=A0A8J2U5H6_9GAMM|nr:TIGR02922 family protein [Neiella marina]GGA78796.1 TIGR02922 family protein [Neiella marina]
MKTVTVLYYTNSDLRLSDSILELDVRTNGRVVIPADFKQGKQIIAVLEGECKLLNRLGERIVPQDAEETASEGSQLYWD